MALDHIEHFEEEIPRVKTREELVNALKGKPVGTAVRFCSSSSATYAYIMTALQEAGIDAAIETQADKVENTMSFARDYKEFQLGYTFTIRLVQDAPL